MGPKNGEGEKERLAMKKSKNVNNDTVFNDPHVNSTSKDVFNGLNCIYTNTDSLPNKLADLEARIQGADEMIDIIAITEVYPKNCRYLPGKAELNITGYDLYLSDHTGSKRGVALYINQTLKWEEVKVDNTFEESIWVKIKLKGMDQLLLGCIYRSPNSSDDNTRKLNQMLLHVSSIKEFTHLLIMGDFNLPKLDWMNWTSKGDKSGEEFMENTRDCYLYQHVTKYTRARANSEPSTLDLIFTNEEDMIESICHESPLGHSDHCVLKFKFKCYQDRSQEQTQRWNYYKGDYVNMQKELDIDWDNLFEGLKPNQMIDLFLSKYNEARQKHIPIINSKAGVKAKKHNYLPLDDKTVAKIKKKHRCWQRYIESRDENKYKEYTRTRNQVKKMVRKAKRNMEMDIAKNVKENPKKFWQYANSKRKTKTGISELKYQKEDGSEGITEGDKQKAEVLANFFSSVFTQEPDGDIPNIENVEISHPFQDKEISEEEVLKIMKDLKPNKSAGPDELHPKSLLEMKETLSKPLALIFNSSLKTGQVPEMWKLGNIVAIFKKGDKSEPGNYRPVSLTSVVCKLMEKLVRNQIVGHMTKNSLFSNRQFGFITGRSTTLQLLKVLDEWTEILDEGGTIDAIYMDFMKAFDKVPHRRLVRKMERYGLSGKIIEWVRDFLNQRKQRVSVNGNSSTDHNVTSGIPQGSVLGPILFVIYINDMPDCVDATAYLFADDTKVYKDIKRPHDRICLQTDLNSLQTWSDTWLLKFHPNKCKAISISNKKNTEDINQKYHLYDNDGNQVKLDQSDGEKDIGVLVDENINFSKHIQQQINKANSIMGLIRRTYTFLDERSFKYLFQALVRPHLEYAAAVWSPYKIADIESIENVQRRATKLIPSLKSLEYPQRLRKLKMPTLKYRRLRGDMIETFKILKGIYDKEVTDKMLALDTNVRTRGNSLKLKKRFSRLNIRKFSFTNRIVDPWNSLPEHIIQAKTVKSFEIALDNHWEKQEVKFDHTKDLELQQRPGSCVQSGTEMMTTEMDTGALEGLRP